MPINYFVTAVFTYSWIWFSNNMVHNAYLALLEDGYVKQGKSSKFSWLRDDLEDPDN